LGEGKEAAFAKLLRALVRRHDAAVTILLATCTYDVWQVNGRNVTFHNCDRTPNSYYALFPNFAERHPTNYASASTFGFWYSTLAALDDNPSTRVMPAEYFMFFEGHFGGCGMYTQTDGRLSIGDVLNVAIGFR